MSTFEMIEKILEGFGEHPIISVVVLIVVVIIVLYVLSQNPTDF